MQDGFPVFLFGISFMLNSDTDLSTGRINSLIILTSIWYQIYKQRCAPFKITFYISMTSGFHTLIKSCYTAVYKQKRQIQVLRTVQRNRGQHSLGRIKRSSETTYSKNDPERRCNWAQGFRFSSLSPQVQFGALHWWCRALRRLFLSSKTWAIAV